MRNFKWIMLNSSIGDRTSVAEIPGGILVRTESWCNEDAVSEALCFVPDVRVNEFSQCLELDRSDPTTGTAYQCFS